MNRILLATLIAITLIIGSCKSNKNKSDNKDNIQKSDTITEEYFFPEEFVYNQSTDVLVDKLFPIGWSKDGKLAYILEPADEAIGAYIVRFVIKDLINNKIIWDKEKMIELNGGEDINDLRASTWKSYYTLIKRKLNQYGIIQQKHFTLKSPYFKYKGEDYIIEMHKQIKHDTDMNLDIITGLQIVIKSPNKGSKVAYEEKMPKVDYILNAVLKGCFISPYEDRIAILITTERRGYEGPPNVVSPTIVGTNLETGFKK